MARIISDGTSLHGFYYEFYIGPIGLTFGLHHRTRSVSGSSWTNTPTALYPNTDPVNSPIEMGVTNDDVLHVAYSTPGGIYYSLWDGSWETYFIVFSGSYVNQQLSVNSNDIYVLWIDDDENTLKLRQRDFAPLTPTDIAGSIEDPSGDKHPRLDWNANGEADLSGYEIHKKVGSGNWALLATTANTYNVDETVTGASFQQYSNNVVISYKIRAKDLQNHLSDFSSPVDFNTRGSGQDKPISWKPLDSGVPGEFSLLQNYPNPFNPLTTIQFSLKEAGPAEVAVYSIDGREIATLVNEFMEAGMYHVQWDGKDQQGNPASSGMYLYQLKTGEQRLVKKMMLIKQNCLSFLER